MEVGSSDDRIVLDPSILYWVLVPIVLVMFLQGILRQYITVLLSDEKKTLLSTLHKSLLLRRSGRLRSNGHFLPGGAYRMRKAYFVQKAFRDRTSSAEGGEGSSQQQAQTAKPDSEANPQDPFAMVGMMKQNMAGIVPNMLLMAWVSYFFSGFVLVKLPFGLSHRFKSMLQRGIYLRTLDPSYVSSLSWYFLNLFGLRGLFSLVLGDNNISDNLVPTKAMQDQMTGGANMQQVDYNQLFSVERTELEILQHDCSIPAAEHRLLAAAT